MLQSSLLASALLVVVAGVSVAFQQILNANLRVQLASPWWAGFMSYFVGMVGMLAVAWFAPGPRLTLAALGEPGSAWIAWTGGLFGAFFIAVVILMVPRMGAATVLALIVVGQMLGSLAFDHFGLLGTPQHSISLVRVAGAGLLVAGVLLIRA
jgi:transporter family-2 protein